MKSAREQLEQALEDYDDGLWGSHARLFEILRRYLDTTQEPESLIQEDGMLPTFINPGGPTSRCRVCHYPLPCGCVVIESMKDMAKPADRVPLTTPKLEPLIQYERYNYTVVYPSSTQEQT